ncbi:hypothetical protein [Kitasatospora sp. McL0602]|uniref:hypothetical protein n=1 Tax=Kitasatospora sp. McL0602 TaxID=3439530 RepID=UPI003F89F6C7
MLAVGFPWVQLLLDEADPRNAILRWLRSVLLVPGWQPSLARDHFSAVADWRSAIACAGLLLGCYLLPPRVLPRVAPGLMRWTAALGTGVLIGLLAVLPSWFATMALLDLGQRGDSVLIDLLVRTVAFGALLGLAAGALYPPDTANRSADAPRAARPFRLPGRSAQMPTPAPPAVGSTPGDVTRYLCAAAYRDPLFTRGVIEDLLGDELGAVATSPGLDLVPVARHCLTARELHHRRDRRLAAVLAVLLLVAPAWLFISVLALITLNGAAAARGIRRVPAPRGRARTGTTTLVVRICALTVVVLAEALLAAIGLGAAGPNGPWQWVLGTYLYGIPAVLAMLGGLGYAYLTVLRHESDVDARLRSTLRRPVFDPAAKPKPAPAAPWAEDRLTTVAEAQSGNVTVYSGYTPFIGFSAAQTTWSLTIPLLPARPEDTVTEFDTWEILGAIRSRLASLTDAATEGGIGGLLLEDRVFVDGSTLHGDQRFLDGTPFAPLTQLGPEELREAANHPTGAVRHYLAAHLPLWGDDVVPSMFLHLSTAGRTLHLQCETHVLGPVLPDYHAVDNLPAGLSDEHRRGLLLAALGAVGGAVRGALPGEWRYLTARQRRNKRLLRDHAALRHDPAFDYGARLSIRESVVAPTYQNYFQVVDAVRTLASLNRHTLAAVREFLDAHQADTTDFRSQQQTILNHGILQQGGVSIVGNQAVGTAAQAVTTGAGETPPTVDIAKSPTKS